MQLPTTANPPHLLTVGSRSICFTRLASHIYDLALIDRDGNSRFIGRIEQKSPVLWAITYIECHARVPEYFDDWQQAVRYLVSSIEFIDFG